MKLILIISIFLISCQKFDIELEREHIIDSIQFEVLFNGNTTQTSNIFYENKMMKVYEFVALKKGDRFKIYNSDNQTYISSNNKTYRKYVGN